MKKETYKCVIKRIPVSPFDSYEKAEYNIDDESGSILFRDLYLTYKLENKQLSMIVETENPCHGNCYEEHFVLQLNEVKDIGWAFSGSGQHYFYEISFINS